MVIGPGANIFLCPATPALNTSAHSCALHPRTDTRLETHTQPLELLLQGWTGHLSLPFSSFFSSFDLLSSFSFFSSPCSIIRIHCLLTCKGCGSVTVGVCWAAFVFLAYRIIYKVISFSVKFFLDCVLCLR